MADQVAPGLDELNQLRAGGFSDDEISQYQTEQTSQLQAGGFTQDEINAHWGVKKFDPAGAKRMVAENHAAEKAKREPVDTSVKPVEAQSWEDVIAAGWGMGITSLALHGKPDVVLPENAGMAAKIIAQIPQLAGDAPAIAAGMLAGSSAGGTVGSAVPVLGTAVGAAYGASAGAFAVPAAMRKLYMDHYEKGDIQSAGDFAARVAAATWEGIKGGAVGAVTAGAGRFAGPVVNGVAGATASKIAVTGSEIAAMTTAAAALEGHLPKLEDFAVGVVTVAGLHAMGKALPLGRTTGQKLAEIYRRTGETPADVAQAATVDPVLKQELVIDHAEISNLPAETPVEASAPEGSQSNKNGPGAAEGEGGQASATPAENSPETAAKLSPDEKAILARIGEDGERPKESVAEKWQNFRTENIDKHEPLLEAGATKTYEMARRYNAVADKIKGFFEDGTRDFKTQDRNGEGLIPIFKENETANVDPGNRGLLAYMMAKRGLELDARGIESLFDSKSTAEAAKRVVSEGKGKFEAYATRINDFENRILDYWGQSGMMKPEMIEKIKEMNRDHLPLQTIQELDALTGQKGARTSGKVHKVLGSLALKQDPIVSLFRNSEALVKRAEVNRVRQNFIKEMGPELGHFLREIEPEMTRTSVSTEELASHLGLDPDLLERGLNVWRREQPMNGEGRVEIYVDGERKIFEGRPDVVDTLSRLDGDQAAMHTLGKLARGFATALRFGSVENPGFAFTHFWRSQRAAGTYSKTGMVPFLHPLMSMPDFFSKPEVYREWLNDGGAVSSLDRINKDYLENHVFEGTKNAAGEFEFKPETMFEKSWNTLKRGPHLFGEFISLTDNLARYTEYKRAREQGLSREDAAYQGRNVTADYQRKGAKNSALRTATAFLNVHIQVTDRAVQELKGPDRAAFLLKCLGAYTVPHVLLWTATQDDPRMEELQDHQKINAMNIPIDSWRPVASGEDVSAVPEKLLREENGVKMINDGPVVHVPVAGIPEVIFGTAVTAALESFKRKDPKLVEEAVSHVLKDFAAAPIPTVATAPVEHYMNKSLFTGNKIVPNSKLMVLPHEQYDPYTSEVAKQVAKGIGYIPYLREVGPGDMTLESPMVIDNYIRSWTGAGGRMATEIADSALHKVGIGEDRIEPEKNVTEYPGLRRFFTQFPNARPESLTDFDEKYEKAQRIFHSTKDSIKRGDLERVEEIQRVYGPEMVRLTGISKGIANASKLIRMVRADTDNYTPTEKKQIITTTYYQMLQMARAGNETMKEMSKAMKQKDEGN